MVCHVAAAARHDLKYKRENCDVCWRSQKAPSLSSCHLIIPLEVQLARQWLDMKQSSLLVQQGANGMAVNMPGTKDAKNTRRWIPHAHTGLIVYSDQEKRKFESSLCKLLIVITVARGCDDSFKRQGTGTTCERRHSASYFGKRLKAVLLVQPGVRTSSTSQNNAVVLEVSDLPMSLRANRNQNPKNIMLPDVNE